jgi:PilZ domain
LETKTNPRREYIRHTIDVPLEVETVSSPGARLEHGVNVSHGGLAFVSGACLAMGDIIHLRIPTVKPPFEATARVAWCRPEGDAFLVGVQFTDRGVAFRSRMVQQVCSIENYRKEALEREGRRLSPQEAAAEWIERYAGRFPDSEVIRSNGG